LAKSLHKPEEVAETTAKSASLSPEKDQKKREKDCGGTEARRRKEGRLGGEVFPLSSSRSAQSLEENASVNWPSPGGSG